MAEYIYGLGKGLKEPCPPYRSDYIFGAELGDFDVAYFNCNPTVWNATISFDLSAITKGHEVVVALLNIDDAPRGDINFNFKWYRDRDNALLFDFSVSTTRQVWGGTFAYSYIGFVDWEINENGSYRVEITVTGAGSYHRVISFTILGITEEIYERPPHINFINGIISLFATVAEWFYGIWQTTKEWIWPFHLISEPFYSIAHSFDWIVFHFLDFRDWIAWATDRATEVLSSIDIYAFFKDYFDKAVDAYNWVAHLWKNIFVIIGSWWDTVRPDVLGWIAIATQDLTRLRTQWDYFWTVLYPKSVNWDEFLSWWNTEIRELQGLINSSIKELEPLWAGWQEWKGKVTEFFTDPEDWLYKAVDRIIERFW